MPDREGILCRRLREADWEELESFCQEDSPWSQYYPSHAEWLKHALGDAKGPGRAVFGAFESRIRAFEEQAKFELEACVFLKPLFGNAAELKNLVVRPAPSENPTARLPRLGRALIMKAVRHCEIRDVNRLEIEIPQSEHVYISLFLALGFRLASLRERYLPSQSFCVLEKVTGDVYCADPFDMIRLARWALKALLPCNINDPSTVALDDGHRLARISFEGYSLPSAFGVENPAGYDKRFRGSMIVADDGDCEDATIRQVIERNLHGPGQARFVVAHELSADARQLLENARITSFDLNELRLIAGGDRSSLSIPISDVADVEGALTVLEMRLVTDYSKLGEEFIYFLLSGIGCALEVSDEQPGLLAVYCPDWNGKRGIVAYSEILQVESATIENVLQQYDEKIPTTLTATDLEYYRTRSDTLDVYALRCGRMIIFDQVLGLDDPVWREHAAMRDYLKHDLQETNSSYLDSGACALIRNWRFKGVRVSEGQSQKEMPVKKKHVFISYLRENRQQVARVRDTLQAVGEPVWWDGDLLPGADWSRELRRQVDAAYAIIFCFSAESAARTSSGMYPEALDAIRIYRELAPGNIFIIPVRLSECQIPDVEIDATRTLRSLQYVDLFPESAWGAGIDKIVASIRATPFHP